MIAGRAVPWRRLAGLGSAVALAAAGGLHVAWGRGSTFPFRTRAGLDDSVVGRAGTPSPAACFAVAAALVSAAGLVGRSAAGGGRLAHLGSGVVATVLCGRAAFGFAGRTDLLVRGSDSASFRRLDRRVFAPVCLVLGTGAASAAIGPSVATRR